MLPRPHRLTNRKDFADVHRLGRFFSFGRLSLKRKKNNLAVTRLGFVVGLKFSKKAVERNRIRRQLRALAAQNLAQIKSGQDVVVMVQKKERALPTSAALRQDWQGLLKKSQLLIKN